MLARRVASAGADGSGGARHGRAADKAGSLGAVVAADDGGRGGSGGAGLGVGGVSVGGDIGGGGGGGGRDRRRRRRSSSTGSSDSELGRVFRWARVSARSSKVLATLSRDSGALLKEGLQYMATVLRDKGWLGTDKDREALPPIVMAYFLTCLKPALGDRLNPRSAHETETIGEAFDRLLRGDLVGGLTVLVQRFKALELSAYDGDWEKGHGAGGDPQRQSDLRQPSGRRAGEVECPDEQEIVGAKRGRQRERALGECVGVSATLATPRQQAERLAGQRESVRRGRSGGWTDQHGRAGGCGERGRAWA